MRGLDNPINTVSKKCDRCKTKVNTLDNIGQSSVKLTRMRGPNYMFRKRKRRSNVMCESMSLSTKQITRCTLRFYDPEFVKNLNSLYKKVGGTQSSFLGMLIKEENKVVSLSLCCKLAFWSIEPILFNTPSKPQTIYCGIPVY